MLRCLSPIARSVIWMTGWKPLSKEFIQALDEHPRKVVIFPHTTFWEFPIMLVYALTHWSLYKNNFCVVMNPKFVNGRFGWLFRRLNCIAATRREDTGNGFIKRTVERFKDSDKFTIVIAPEGTVAKNEWRSGYYYLAKGLGCPIQVIGLDYHIHRIVIKEAVMPLDPFKTEELLKRLMADIPTLHPKNSILPSNLVSTSLVDEYAPHKALVYLHFLGALLALLIPIKLVLFYIIPVTLMSAFVFSRSTRDIRYLFLHREHYTKGLKYIPNHK